MAGQHVMFCDRDLSKRLERAEGHDIRDERRAGVDRAVLDFFSE
jgi:hypothetical protein